MSFWAHSYTPSAEQNLFFLPLFCILLFSDPFFRMSFDGSHFSLHLVIPWCIIAFRTVVFL
jgi:hypothetical protein